MKIDQDFKLMNIAGENIVVALGSKNVNFNKMISLNNSGAFLWQQLQEEKTEEELLCALLKEYNVDQDSARNDIKRFIAKLIETDMMES